ncbi:MULTISPECIES: hypothetical protein [unclassified Streptomyces]|uniref:hypothetical protein n=1 Tax=unclassified Streptomyces TaxID=2593676 RepID=UPI00214C31D3|nr:MULTISPECIES: hypothetical protein [unclassified Streptomyces]
MLDAEVNADAAVLALAAGGLLGQLGGDLAHKGGVPAVPGPGDDHRLHHGLVAADQAAKALGGLVQPHGTDPRQEQAPVTVQPDSTVA